MHLRINGYPLVNDLSFRGDPSMIPWSYGGLGLTPLSCENTLPAIFPYLQDIQLGTYFIFTLIYPYTVKLKLIPIHNLNKQFDLYNQVVWE